MTGRDDTPHFRPHQRVTVEGWPGTVLGSHRNSAGGPAYAVSLDDRGVFSVNARQIVPAGDGQLPFPEETTRVRLRQLANGLRDLEAVSGAAKRAILGGVEITADDLHAAADIIGSFGDDESKLAEYGLPWAELEAFVDGSDWRDRDANGPVRDMDPLALAVGISIGVIAAEKALEEMVGQ